MNKRTNKNTTEVNTLGCDYVSLKEIQNPSKSIDIQKKIHGCPLKCFECQHHFCLFISVTAVGTKLFLKRLVLHLETKTLHLEGTPCEGDERHLLKQKRLSAVPA
ncbi:hypothetical protein ATANTOWER_000683 [Ataeniobius toweri]|uniref:Uncharacterized protein n=1 Tax=Ataeniobius toweri TaxID=208326 RepID=A0ABU7AWZ9_9TELE|nr:hypothetical protein [Ataeniobius toweri]